MFIAIPYNEKILQLGKNQYGAILDQPLKGLSYKQNLFYIVYVSHFTDSH